MNDLSPAQLGAAAALLLINAAISWRLALGLEWRLAWAALRGAVQLALVGVLLIVPDSLFVRLIDAEPLATAFWRGLTAGAIVFVWMSGLLARRRLRALDLWTLAIAGGAAILTFLASMPTFLRDPVHAVTAPRGMLFGLNQSPSSVFRSITSPALPLLQSPSHGLCVAGQVIFRLRSSMSTSFSFRAGGASVASDLKASRIGR